MTTTSRVLASRNLDYRRLLYPESCGADLVYWSQEVAKWREVVDSPIEHRDHPGDRPYLYPTAQTLQSTTTKQYGVVKSPLTYGGRCGPYREIYYIVDKQNVDPGGLISSQGPVLDWQTKMRLDIKETAVNLGTSLVEYRDTAKLFHSFAKGMKTAWSLYRGRLPKRWRRKLRPCDVAAAELTTSYGVEPLVSDLYDSFWALQGRLVDPIYRRFVSFASDSESVEDTSFNESKGQWEVSERAICYVELEPNRSDFTLGNPLELAWEVIPFSFVVDWGIPIGDYLRALDALKDVKSVAGTVTRKQKYQHTTRSYNVVNNGWEVIEPAILRYESHQRDAVFSIPVPNVPSWDPSTSWRAVVHGLSLLTVLNQRCR